jgi:hypothetical protein
VNQQIFRSHRAQFSREELAKYRGQWVAFSADGRRILASGETLECLEQKLAAQGSSPQEVVLEGIPGPEDDTFLGAEELR